MVKYFSLGLWWISRGNPPLIFLSPCGIERRSYKTHDVIAIDTELPIVERVPTLPFIQKLLPVFHLISLLFLQGLNIINIIPLPYFPAEFSFLSYELSVLNLIYPLTNWLPFHVRSENAHSA